MDFNIRREMMSQGKNYNTILIGDENVGKTSIMLSYYDKLFPLYNISIFQFPATCWKRININDSYILIETSDTCGQERSMSMGSFFYKNVKGIMVVYDVTNRRSFDDVNIWLEEARKENTSNAQYILVGNKCDLINKSMVSREEGQDFADHLGIPFIEVSVNEKINVERLFETIATNIYNTL